MNRDELLRSPYYWEGKMQEEIYRHAVAFMEKNKMNRTQFAAYLGVSKGYVSQILSGDCNFSIEKLCELALKLGLVPSLHLQTYEEATRTKTKSIKPSTARYKYASAPCAISAM